MSVLQSEGKGQPKKKEGTSGGRMGEAQGVHGTRSTARMRKPGCRKSVETQRLSKLLLKKKTWGNRGHLSEGTKGWGWGGGGGVYR